MKDEIHIVFWMKHEMKMIEFFAKFSTNKSSIPSQVGANKL